MKRNRLSVLHSVVGIFSNKKRIIDVDQSNKLLKEKAINFNSNQYADNVMMMKQVSEKIDELSKKLSSLQDEWMEQKMTDAKKTTVHQSFSTVSNIKQKSETPRASRISKQITLCKAISKEQNNKYQSRSLNTLRNYETGKNALLNYLQKKDIALSAITTNMMQGFQKWLLKNGICKNTTACYMRSLRAIYNRYYKKSHDSASYPFSNLITGNIKSTVNALNKKEVIAISKLKLKPGTEISLCYNVLVFSYFSMGMPYVDVFNLKKKDIVDGEIIYQRHKTAQPVHIPLEPEILKIIKKYDDPNSKYIFPELRKNIRNGNEISYYSSLSRYNANLKIIAKKANITSKLSSYVIRHTWATLAYGLGVNTNVISKALGHTSTKTTMCYINGIDNEKVFDANRKMIHYYLL